MKCLLVILTALTLSACGGGGSSSGDSSNESISFPTPMQRLPDHLQSFSPGDRAQEILFADLKVVANVLSSEAAANAYSAIPNSLPHEEVVNGCGYYAGDFFSYYISITCTDESFSIEGLKSTSWLTLWLEDWSSGSRIYHKYVYKPEANSISYIRKDFRGSVAQVEEAIFLLSGGSVKTDYFISYVE